MQSGTVRHRGKKHVVELDCQSTCTGCRGCAGQRFVDIEGDYPDGARVQVHLGESRFVRASLLLWGTLIAALVVGLLVGYALAGEWLAAVLALALPLLSLAAFKARDVQIQKRYGVHVTLADDTLTKEAEKMSNIQDFQGDFDLVLDHNGLVLVDFYADWCKPCKQLGAVLEEIASEHPEVLIVKIDATKEKQLVAQQEVQSIPTLLVYKDGEEMLRIIGSRNKGTLVGLLKDFM